MLLNVRKTVTFPGRVVEITEPLQCSVALADSALSHSTSLPGCGCERATGEALVLADITLPRHALPSCRARPRRSRSTLDAAEEEERTNQGH